MSRRNAPLVALPFVLFLAALPLADAARATSREVAHGVEEFLEGELEGLAIDALGQLVVAPVISERWETEALYAWCLALDRRGRLLVGTGDGGTIYREEDGALVEWADTLALEILSLLVREGHVLAGSSPDGIVYRVEANGAVSIELDLPQQSVWSLVEGSRAGTWVAGTGPGARLLRGGRGAEAGEELHSLPATNVTVLLRDGTGLWIGTQGPGLVYRIEGEDDATPRLRYEATQDEVRALISDGEGGAYVLSVDAGQGNGAEAGARITWLPRGGAAEAVWEGGAALLSLTRLADGAFLGGEAATGRLLRIDLDGRLGLWAELEGGDPLVLLRRGEETFAATGNLGAVFRLHAPGAERGNFVAPVAETARAERWGRLQVEFYGGDVRFRARSGVRALPDETWSEWTDWSAAGETITAPVAPYLQYELQVQDAAVGAVTVSWGERNLAPRVTKLKVESPGGDLSLGSLNASPSQVSQRFDDGLGVEYQVQKPARRAPPEAAAWARGLRTIVWQGEDPNEDELRYRVEVRRLPEGEWGVLIDDHPERLLAWDTRAMEDGHYRVRVTATDAAVHPPGAAREGSMVSGAVHVDNGRPRLEQARRTEEAILLVVVDESSPLVETHWRSDDGEWIPAAPEDGVVDAPRERFKVPADAVAGFRRVWLRAVDRAGNTLVQQVVLDELR